MVPSCSYIICVIPGVKRQIRAAKFTSIHIKIYNILLGKRRVWKKKKVSEIILAIPIIYLF